MSFKYFGYGSNLSRYRLALSCPSAKKYAIGKLAAYKLVFGRYSKSWNGAVASIQESANSKDRVWGVVWNADIAEQEFLDIQEGVSAGIYRPLEVDIETLSGDVVKCRTYQLADLGGTQKYGDPSPQYHRVILDGAERNSLPEDYLAELRKTVTNGNTEITELMRSVAEMRKG